METLKDKIFEMFYIKHLKVKDIAEREKKTTTNITKVVKTDVRYKTEKAFRKNKSKEKRKLDQNKFNKQKREKQRIEDNYAFVQEQHKEASRELSKSKRLSDENYRKWNKSAYTYNPSKHRYEFDKTLGRSYDVPKYIKER